LLGITSFFLLATQVLRWDLTLATGLSAKNVVIYMLATFLALRLVIARGSVVAAGQMQAAFLVQIAYAICTMLIAGLVIKYNGYDVVNSGIKLKSILIDYFIFFLVFLYGIRTLEDGVKVIKWLLAGAIFANLATILDAGGLINLGYIERFDGRTQGAIGESNQYASYIILFIPGLIAAAVASRGFMRLAWLGGALVSCAALVMTASRGGFVGIIIASVIAAYLYRKLVSYSRIAGWVLGCLALFVLVMSFSQYGGLLTERVIGQSSNIDVVEASSGRSEIWTNLLLTMMSSPVTFVTGFGWDVYWSFPFRFSPHNHYLSMWFNLGLVGLVTSVALLFGAIRRARRASLEAKPPIRGQMIAFVVGGIAIAASVFFVDLHEPWYYFWMYTGVVMRMAYVIEAEAATEPVTKSLRLRGPARDPYGWTAAHSSTPGPRA
jgi:hypothetical protein